MLRMLHGAMFCRTGLPDTYDAFLGGVMTVGEREAIYLIRRATLVYHRLPKWMKERNPLVTDNNLLMRFRNDGTIQAFPMQREGPQTFGFTRVFFDEMALQEAARSTWMGMIPTLGDKGKLLAVSTPNGKGNLFYDVWSNKNERFRDLNRISVMWDGEIRKYDTKGEVKEYYSPQIAPHDEKWFKKVTAAMDKPGIARNFELSFASYAGMAVWNEFDFKTHVVPETEIIKNSPMLIGWDFGFHFPAVTFWQYNGRDQFMGHREYADFDIGFDRFVKEVIVFANTFYDRKRIPEAHFVDPAGFQRYHSRSQSGAVSDVMEIKAAFKRGGMNSSVQIRPGAVEVGTRNNEGPRLKEVRRLWSLRADGNPGIVINECMTGFVEGCQGAYAYPEKGGEVPEKLESSHIQDTLQYLVTGYKRMGTSDPKKGKTELKVDRIGYRTGM